MFEQLIVKLGREREKDRVYSIDEFNFIAMALLERSLSCEIEPIKLCVLFCAVYIRIREELDDFARGFSILFYSRTNTPIVYRKSSTFIASVI